MARQNFVMLYGRVCSKPRIVENVVTKEYVIAIVRIETVRGLRSAHNGTKNTRHDIQTVITREPVLCEEIASWHTNDVVLLKGILASAETMRTSFCPFCDSKDEFGELTSTKVQTRGLDIFVIMIAGTLVKHYDNQESAIIDVENNREMSNQVYLTGGVRTKPKIFYTKSNLMITQYQLDITRKFKVRLDDPGKREDMPWCKSYKEIAFEDSLRIIQGKTEVQIEGYIQTRKIMRKTKCPNCGQFHIFNDTVMEIVPYSVDYLREYKTDEMLQQEHNADIEEIKQKMFNGIEHKSDDSEDVSEFDVL